MRQPSPRTYLVISGAIMAALVGTDLIQLATTGRIPLRGLRSAAFTAAAVFAAVGASSWQTHQTLELARRLEQVRSANGTVGNVVAFPDQARAVE